MMASGFKPVGWVAAVATAALGCYMLSLNVASERADLAKVESRIVAAKQDIRSLQTELGTRGRMAQLEQWNADVLALSAPATTQFMDNEVKLARFDVRTPALDQGAQVRLAAADLAPSQPDVIGAPVVTAAAPTAAPAARLAVAESAPTARLTAATTAPAARLAVAAPAPASRLGSSSLVHRASLEMASVSLPRPAMPRRTNSSFADAVGSAAKAATKRIDAGLVREISAAAKVEAGHSRK